jgi:hypothetical protein
MEKKIVNRIVNSFGALLVVPTLSVLSGGLLVCSIIVVVCGILRTFGMDFIQMNIGSGVEIPQILSIPVALVTALLLVAVAFGSLKLLKKYLSFVKS